MDSISSAWFAVTTYVLAWLHWRDLHFWLLDGYQRFSFDCKQASLEETLAWKVLFLFPRWLRCNWMSKEALKEETKKFFHVSIAICWIIWRESCVSFNEFSDCMNFETNNILKVLVVEILGSITPSTQNARDLRLSFDGDAARQLTMQVLGLLVRTRTLQKGIIIIIII